MVVQVLNNLLSQCIQVLGGRPQTIRVAASRDEFYVAFSVTDEGSGIPADQLSSLFEKFSRINDGGRERSTCARHFCCLTPDRARAS